MARLREVVGVRHSDRNGQSSSGVDAGLPANYSQDDPEILTVERGRNNRFLEFFDPDGDVGASVIARKDDVLRLEVVR